jgi:hypothetical protein
LYADTIILKSQGGTAMPIALPIFIGLVGPTEPLNEDLRLVTDEFTRRGGLLLTPDEFMAALNPEFMIGWATSMLGSDHPALQKAQGYLTQGQFLQSLVTVREALRTFPESTYTSSDGKVTILANAWITDLQLDLQAGNLTHSSPITEIHTTLQLPMDIYREPLTVRVDGVPIMAKIVSDGTTRRVEFVLTGGSHEVQVVKP